MKNQIIIHNPIVYKHKRYYNIFFDQLIEELSNIFDVVQNRLWPEAHKNPMFIKLLCENDFQKPPVLHDQPGHRTVDQQGPMVGGPQDLRHTTRCRSSLVLAGPCLLECEMILEHCRTKEIKILSVSDLYTHANLTIFNNDYYRKYIKTILVSQFNRKSIEHHTKNRNNDVYRPWIYFPHDDYDLETLYQKRQTIKNDLIKKFYFRGSGTQEGQHRPLISIFNKSLFYGGESLGSFDRYGEELIHYLVGFSCAGTAQFCYRDIEYMAMGVPMLRFTYINEMNPPLVPNEHYIAIEPAFETHEEYTLTKTHAELVEKRFLEVKNDKDFLAYISQNARDYYKKYIYKNSGINHTINLLDLKDWL